MGGLSALANLVPSVLDKIFPDKEKANEAKLKFLELEQKGEFRGDELRYEAITTEAKSDDPMTSRARPTFLYVMYIYILAGIPYAIFYSFYPDNAVLVAAGLKAWFDAIPGEMYALFGAGYLGYGAYRTYDKHKNGEKERGIKGLIKGIVNR